MTPNRGGGNSAGVVTAGSKRPKMDGKKCEVGSPKMAQSEEKIQSFGVPGPKMWRKWSNFGAGETKRGRM